VQETIRGRKVLSRLDPAGREADWRTAQTFLKSDYDVVRADDAGSARRHEKRLRTDFGEWLGY
jgi:hypothetical protein